MNVDIGGGTSKIAVCAEGKVIDLTAVDVGARLVCLEPDGRIVRVEEAGRRFAAELGIDLLAGATLAPDQGRAHRRRDGGPAVRGDAGRRARRCRARDCCAPIPSPIAARSSRSQFSGGVSEYIYGREAKNFGDLGPLLAAEIRARVEAWDRDRAFERGHPRDRGRRLAIHDAGQRQHHLRRAARGGAAAQRAGDRADAADRRRDHRSRRGVAGDQGDAEAPRSRRGRQPVAVFVPWRGSATFQRLDAFCKGAVEGLVDVLANGHPLVLAGDGDVGGLIGIHLHEEMKLANAIVSIDGLELKDFDYIDIGTMLARRARCRW